MFRYVLSLLPGIKGEEHFLLRFIIVVTENESRLPTTLWGGNKMKKHVAFLFVHVLLDNFTIYFFLDQPTLIKSFLLSLCIFPVFWGELVVFAAFCCNLNEKLKISILPNFFCFSVGLVVLKGFCWLLHSRVYMLAVYWRVFG